MENLDLTPLWCIVGHWLQLVSCATSCISGSGFEKLLWNGYKRNSVVWTERHWTSNWTSNWTTRWAIAEQRIEQRTEQRTGQTLSRSTSRSTSRIDSTQEDCSVSTWRSSRIENTTDVGRSIRTPYRSYEQMIDWRVSCQRHETAETWCCLLFRFALYNLRSRVSDFCFTTNGEVKQWNIIIILTSN